MKKAYGSIGFGSHITISITWKLMYVYTMKINVFGSSVFCVIWLNKANKMLLCAATNLYQNASAERLLLCETTELILTKYVFSDASQKKVLKFLKKPIKKYLSPNVFASLTTKESGKGGYKFIFYV